MRSDETALLVELLAEVRALRVDLTALGHNKKTPRQVRREKRETMIRLIADATNMGHTYACATHIQLILCGKQPVPIGHEHSLSKLLKDDECPVSVRQLWRIINDDH